MTNEKLSIPSQVFKWFEKMKSNYERNVVAVLDRFERHAKEQQTRVDGVHTENLRSLADSHQALVTSQQQQIEQLQQDVQFYRAQLSQQNKTIDQLNQRYDAVIAKLFIQVNEESILKDIEEDTQKHSPNVEKSDDANFITKLLKEYNDPDSHLANPAVTAEHYFKLAVEHRNQEKYNQAIKYFEKAAEMKHAKAMGALGRAYFLAEGVEENPVIGLSWLIEAAEHGLSQAKSRVEFYKENEPDLYYLATST